MSRNRTSYQCTACGSTSPQWVGRCPGCDTWNTLEQITETVTRLPAGLPARRGPMRVGEVAPDRRPSRPTGIDELDRVLGGGLTAGSVTLLGGEPGIGKSTLLLQGAASVASGGTRCLYVSAEESAAQVRGRAERLGALDDDLWLVHETDLDTIVGHIAALDPGVVVIDSIQTVHDSGAPSAAGSVTQVRAAAGRLVELAKRSGTSVVLVGHVTKDGALAGPRQLEHVVDTVLGFEGERHHALRLLRALKHRFGATEELGVFEMGAGGLAAVADPSGLFLADCRFGVPGAAVASTMDGRRPLLVEIQALVARVQSGAPKRSAIGLDAARLGMLMAVLGVHGRLELAGHEVYTAVAGGLRVTEPTADLALALAIASAYLDVALPSDLVAIGEVGLAGELRQVSHLDRRLAEAARLGFTRAMVPMLTPRLDVDIECVRVATVREAVGAIAADAPVGR